MRCVTVICIYTQGGREYWNVDYPGPQSFITTFLYLFALKLWILDLDLGVQTFKPIILIYRKDNCDHGQKANLRDYSRIFTVAFLLFIAP